MILKISSIKQLNKFFFLFLIYQIIAVVSLFGCYPSDIFFTQYSIYGLIITFPISIFSFMIRFAEPDLEMTVIIIQSVIFLISALIYVLLKRKIQKSNDTGSHYS